MKAIYDWLDRQNKYYLLVAGLAGVGLVGFIDYQATWQINVSIFYLVILAIVSYHGGWLVGLIIAIVSIASWSAVEISTGMPYTIWFAPLWNAGVRLAMYCIICFGLSSLRKRVRQIESMARTDSLTGISNRRCFCELAGIEIKRASRYRLPFTVVYIDVDGFKAANDEFGHEIGDHILCTVAETLRVNLRETDFLARLGGDEFVVLLSHTGEEQAAQYLKKMNEQLLKAMQGGHWKITFSIGAVTYLGIPSSVDEMIGRADDLMYGVKQTGKNGIKHEVFGKGAEPN